MNERELIEMARTGSKEAFCSLYSIYRIKLYKYALYKLGSVDDAEDAVSDCVLSAYQQITSLKNSSAFSVWLFRILNASCASVIKRRINARVTDDIEEHKASASYDFSGEVLKTELSEALSILTEEECAVVLLSVICGFKSREISRITGLTAGSVRSKLSRSLAKMRAFLESDVQ